MTDRRGSSMKKTAAAAALTLLALLGPGPAAATRLLGDVAQRPAAARARALPVVQMYSGIVTAVRASDPRGVQLEIDGRWWLVLRGRTSVLRDGRLVDVQALAAGQTVRYAPASTMRGESALGVVHVP
jgi:hypothetical protein